MSKIEEKIKEVKDKNYKLIKIANNKIHEVQGEQHFRPVKFGGMSLKKAKKNFEKQKKRDKIKKDFCICNRNNIKLIELSYEKIRNADENILKDIF